METHHSYSFKSLALTEENINTNDNDLSNQHINEFPYDYNQFSKQIKFLNHLAGNILMILMLILYYFKNIHWICK